ncbi:hypothetical protein ACFSE0_16195 [Ochrobactrum teleogrylli]|uniref:GNAT family N-acetyltransferase n=1 Tax=Ochrobactrum teleogrylli TaxID=2479765 RepID=A0ABY2Y5U2_9HYPH|nr:hypothetical protein [[Ochrobactrum] teleogrylli]TNV16892.1 hypothetical protein FIC94_06860 [[Ochrobactrum] teleogrylli]
MRVDDIPAVRDLFRQVFRPEATSNDESFDRYFQQVFFENPYYDADLCSIVHEDSKGEIDSTLCVLPIPYHVDGKIVMGRLLCAYMMRPGSSPRGAAELTLTLRSRPNDFSFSDSAAPVSTRHFSAVGGITLDTHGLAWTRIFRAASYVAQFVAERRVALRGWPAAKVGQLLDPLVPLPKLRTFTNGKLTVQDIEQSDAIGLIRHFLPTYDAYPAWTEQDLHWVLNLARDNRAAGALRSCSVSGTSGEPVGFFCYYARPNGIAEVLSILAPKNREQAVVEVMLSHLQEAGHIAAQGRADPHFLGALSQQSVMFFRLKANVCVVTANPDVLNALDHNDIFVGGLAGESWSRLVTDFQ